MTTKESKAMDKHPSKVLGLALAVLLLCGGAASAQSLPPKWLNSGLTDLRFSYVEVVSGDASSVNAARDKAAQAIVQRRNLAAGTEVTVRVVNGQITSSGSQDMIVTARILDEYVEELDHGSYRVYLLVQTLKHPQYNFENVTVTDQYPFSARAFVPGMEQLHKGQTTKGLLFIVGEAACVGGIIAAEGMRANYENMINSTHNAQLRANYIDKTNTWQNVRNGCIGAAAAVYLWNIIDAVTSKGGRYIKIDGANLALAPIATTQFTGMALNINF